MATDEESGVPPVTPDPAAAGSPPGETTQAKSARLKALRLQEKEAVAARVAKATRKARARRDVLR